MPQCFSFTLLLCLFFTAILPHASAQETLLKLDTAHFSPDQQINLAAAKEWLFHPGHNPAWSRPDLNTNGWQKRKLSEFSITDSDQSDRAEGWFRLRLQLEPNFAGIPVFFRKSGWAAVDLYLDGRLVATYGSTGTGSKPYQQYFFFNKLSVPADLKPGREHVIALHVVDYLSPINPGRLKSEIGIDPASSFRLVGIRYQTSSEKVFLQFRYL